MALDLLSGLTPEIMAALQEEYLAGEHSRGFDTILEEEEEDEEEEEREWSPFPPQGGSSNSPTTLKEPKGQVRIFDSNPNSSSLEFGKQLNQHQRAPSSTMIAKPSVRVRKEEGVIRLSKKLQELSGDSSSMRTAISSQ
jgi:hypothetical protein